MGGAETNTPTKKEKIEDCHKDSLKCGGIAYGKISALAAEKRAFRLLRLKCELHSASQSEVRTTHLRPKGKDRGLSQGQSSIFLVEVWRFELQASSTRNWRATNCATPRNKSRF